MRFLPLFLLVACAPTQEQFEEDTWEMSCDLMFDCTTEEERSALGPFWIFGETAQDCYALDDETTEDTAGADEDCDYDKQAAKECLAELETLTCDDFGDFGYETPEPCDRVCDGGS